MKRIYRCTQHRFRSDHHQINTERVHKIALNNKDDKRIQSSDTTYRIGLHQDFINESEQEIRERPIQLYY